MGPVAQSPWFKRHVGLYEKDRQVIAAEFPTLAYTETNDKILLSGQFHINHSHSAQAEPIIDRFEIEIKFAADYPDSLPKVYEVGGRKDEIAKARGINNLRDLHFNVRDEDAACLAAPIIARNFFPRGSTINIFLNELVARFFYGLSHYGRHGEFPFGELKHGDEGISESYRDKFGLDDLAVIIEAVKRLANEGPIRGHLACPCGSPKRFRTCHPDVFRRLVQAKQDMSRNEVLTDLRALQALVTHVQTAEQDLRKALAGR